MFQVTQSPTFWSPVKAEVTDENGKKVEVRWLQQFKRLTVDEAKAIVEEVRENRKEDADVLCQVTVGWKELVDEEKQPLPYTEEALRGLCNGGFSPAMLMAFYDGFPKAKAKN